jgi:O-acetylhomoserine/O-acetylserine sulfhydrylase-like pyridoxal-dependent enzyme
MRDETIAIHGGCQVDSTRPVAVPIYQTVGYDFIDAEHATRS